MPNDDVNDEIAAMIEMATSEGFDVLITITPTADGKPGTVTLPMAWSNKLAITPLDEVAAEIATKN